MGKHNVMAVHSTSKWDVLKQKKYSATTPEYLVKAMSILAQCKSSTTYSWRWWQDGSQNIYCYVCYVWTIKLGDSRVDVIHLGNRDRKGQHISISDVTASSDTCLQNVRKHSWRIDRVKTRFVNTIASAIAEQELFIQSHDFLFFFTSYLFVHLQIYPLYNNSLCILAMTCSSFLPFLITEQ